MKRPHLKFLILGLLLVQKLCVQAQCFAPCVSPALNQTIKGPDKATTATVVYYSLELGDNLASTWTLSAGGSLMSATGNTVSVYWYGAGNFTLTVRPTNSCGQSAPPVSKTINVSYVADTSTPDITGPDKLCLGQPASFSVPALAGKTVSWYYGFESMGIWPLTAFTQPGIVINNNTFTITWNHACPISSLAQFYVYAAYTSNTTGITGNFTSKNIVNAPDTPVISGNLTPCVNATYDYTVPALQPGDVVTWQLSGGGSLTQNGNMATVTWTDTATPYNLYANVTNSCYANLSTSLIAVNVIPATIATPVLSGPDPETVCNNSTTSYTVTNLKTGDMVIWNLSGGGTLTQNGNDAGILWSTAGTYTLTATASNLCATGTSASSKTITVGPPKPVIPGTINSSSQYPCLGGNVHFNVLPGAGSYEWKVSGPGVNSTVPGQSNLYDWTFNSAGTYQVSVRQHNGICWSDPISTTKEVQLVAPSPIAITAPLETCTGTAVTLSTIQRDGFSYSWNVPGATITSPANTSSVTVTWDTPGIKSGITVQITAPCGLPGTSAPVNVNVREGNITAMATAILGAKTVCNSTYAYSLAGDLTNASSITWSVSPSSGVTVTPVMTNGVATKADVLWSTPGTYVLTSTASTVCGVATARSITVTATTGTKPPAAGSVTGFSYLCSNTAGPYSIQKQPGVTYQWELPDGNGATMSNFIDTGTAIQGYAQWVSPGTYTVAAYPFNGTCQGDGGYKTTLYQRPNPTIEGPANVCKGATVTYTTEEGRSGYTWTVSPGGEIPATTPSARQTVTWLTDGPHTVTVNYKHTGGCMAVTPAVKNVTVSPLPNASITTSGDVCQPGAITFSAPEGTGLTYLWEYKPINYGSFFAVGTNSPTHPSNGPGDYRVKVTNAANCSSTSAAIGYYPVTGGVIAGTQTICNPGNPTIFYETTASTGSSPTYQWVKSTDNINFTNIANAISYVYDAPAGLTETTYYKRITRSGTCSAESNVLTVTINNFSPGVMASDQTICAGMDPVLFTESTPATGSGSLTYQWQSSSNNTNFFNLSGATALTYDPLSYSQTMYYRRLTTHTLNHSPCTLPGNTLTITVNPKTNQVITFDPLPAKVFNDAGFQLTATSSTGLPLTYSSANTSVATISGTTVSITGTGTSTITATQAGDACHNAATASQLLTVNKATPLITFTSAASGAYGSVINLAIDKGGATGAVTYSVAGGTGTASMSDNALTLTGVGTVTVTASVATDANYEAGSVSQEITITKADPLISFTSPDHGTYGGTVVLAVAAGGSAGLPSFTVTNGTGSAAVSGNTLTLLGAGVVTVAVSIGADANYNAAAAEQTFTINKAAPVISFTSASGGTYGGVITLSTSSGGSTGTAAYAVTNGTGSAVLIGNDLSLTGAGTVTVTANVAADANYQAAAGNATITIAKAVLNVVATDVSKTFGAANPALPVTYTGLIGGDQASVIETPPAASTSATACSAVGNYTIVPSGGSDNNYTFTYTNGTLTIGKAMLTAKADDKSRIYALSNPVFTITHTGYVCGDNAIDTPPVPSTTATIFSHAGSYPISLSGGADNSYTFSLVSGTLTIGKADQTVSFSPFPSMSVGDMIVIPATSSSGLPVSFASSDASVVTVSGANLIGSGYGSATITASQAGNINYNAATSVSQQVNIDPFIVMLRGADKFCQGSSTMIYPDIPYASGLTFLWSDGSTEKYNHVSNAGHYYVTVTKTATGESRTSDAMYVTQVPVENGGEITPSPFSCFQNGQGVINLTATPSGNFTWSTGQHSQSIQIYAAGIYSVTITNGFIVRKGCISVPDCFLRTRTPDEPEKIAEFSPEEPVSSSFSCYPNPASDELNIELPEPVTQVVYVRMFDPMGRVVHESTFKKGDSRTTVATYSFTTGIYLIQVQTQSGLLRRKVQVVHKN